MGITGFYWVSMGFFTGFHLLHKVLLGLIGFYWVFDGSDQALLGVSRFSPDFTGL